MPRSPRAWWRAAGAGALIVLATAGPAAATGQSTPAAPPGPAPQASFVVGKAIFEPLDGNLPVGAESIGEYRGSLEVVPDGGGMAVINDVAVEDYVDGISEVPSDWPAAALQAQAIAARTYLLHSAAAPSPVLAAIGAQICADQDCQVYTGLAKARAPYGQQWLNAVASTAGQVLLYRGRPINAMYSSSNGGRTVDGGEPYLRAVDDPDDSVAPLNQWTAQVALADLARALQLPGSVTSISRSGDTVTTTSSTAPPPGQNQPASGQPASGQPAQGQAASPDTTTVPPAPAARNQAVTTLPAPPPTAPTTSTSTTSTTAPPPTTAAPSAAPSGGSAPASGPAPAGTQGTLTTSAADFTHRVNAALPPAPGRDVLLPSDRFDVTMDAANVTFSGGGFGHGIGMSQYGALGKANRGLSAADILAFYYGGLRPQLLPMTAVPASVRVAVGRELTSATVTGRFRLVDENGTVLITVGDGPWRVEPAAGGRIRVVLPDAYRGQFGLAPVTVDPPVVVPGAKLTVHFNLPVPGLASVSATPPGASSVVSDLGITTPGAHHVDLPPATSPGTYVLRIAAAAGAGRQADSVLEITVADRTAAGAAKLGRSTIPGAAVRAGRPRRASMTAGVVVAVVGLLAVSAVVATALHGSRRPT